MIELNNETVDLIKRGLNLLAKFKNINDRVEFDLKDLSLFWYDNCAEEWIFRIITILFNHSIEVLSSEFLTNVDEVWNVIERFDRQVALHYYDHFLDLYGYSHEEDESVLESKKFNDDFEDYYLGLDVRRIEFYAPLVTSNVGIYESFLTYIPALIENSFNLYSHVLVDISTEYNKKYGKRTVVMYVVYERGADFSEDLYIPSLVEAFEELLEKYCVDNLEKRSCC